MMFDTLIIHGKAVLPNQGIRQVNIAIKDGHIAAILEENEKPEAKEIIDAKGLYILPGLIDPHVHWGLYGASLGEQTVTESRSAAIGGVTTVLHYQRRPVFTKESIAEIVNAIEPNSYIDFGLQLFVTQNKHIEGMKTALKEWGISSYKYFTTERNEDSGIEGLSASGITEPYTDGFAFEAMEEMAKLSKTMENQPEGSALCPQCQKKVVGNFHAENIEVLERLGRKVKANTKLTGLAAWDATRPDFLEAETTGRLGFFAEQTNANIYVVHISCKEAADEVARWKAKGVAIYGETCPHYLVLNTESAIGIKAKVNPPIRDKKNNAPLWEALANGVLDTIGSDNCAATNAHKQGDIWTASPGFAGTATILPVLLSEGVNKNRISLERLVEVTSTNAAKIFNMFPKKGAITPGADADLVLVDLNMEKKVDAAYLQSWADFSVYEGSTLKGWPVRTLVRGKTVVNKGEIVGEKGHGQYLFRN